VAKRAVDYSTKTRQVEETFMAFINTYKTTGDPKARQALQDKWGEDNDAITSDDPVLAGEIQRYKDKVMPGMGQTVANHKLAFQARQNKDAHEANLQYLMETGALGEAAKQIQNYQRTTNQISEAEAEQLIKELPNNSILLRARLNIGKGNYRQAEESLTKLKDPNPDQLDEKDKLSRMAKQSYKQTTDLVEIEVINNMFQNKNKSPLEKDALGKQYIAKLSTIGLTGERFGVLSNQIQNWMADKDATTDWATYDKLQTKIENWRGDPNERIVLEKELQEARFGSNQTLDQQRYESLKGDLSKNVNSINTEYEKWGRAYIKDAIIGEPGLLGMAKGQQQDYLRAIDAFTESINTDKLKGEAIKKEAIRLAESNSKTPAERTVENIQRLKDTAEEIKNIKSTGNVKQRMWYDKWLKNRNEK